VQAQCKYICMLLMMWHKRYRENKCKTKQVRSRQAMGSIARVSLSGSANAHVSKIDDVAKRYEIKINYTHPQILEIRPHRPPLPPSRPIPTVYEAVYSRCTCRNYIIGIIYHYSDPLYTLHDRLLACTIFPAFLLHLSSQNQLRGGG
jgi:hypothetical protein